MWSGPRNLSTAMMYAFGNRDDCAVSDEPFYAAYLAATGLDHPMRSEILAVGETDPAKVVAGCLGAVPGGKKVFYQKHMTQHMIPAFDRGWIKECVNVFLIRDPARVIASYATKRENPSLDDLGFRQQADLFDMLCQSQGAAPPVLDSFDVRLDPAERLRALCARIGLDFQPSMLRWPSGGHAGDGIWAAHWYGAVHASTGFAPPEGGVPDIPDALKPLRDQAAVYYEKLREFTL